MNAIFICVIVLDKMCFHMLDLYWFKHKKIFESFRCFWKVLCFYKNWKISKTVLPYFGDLVVGHPSRILQPWARRLVLATCSPVKGPVARGTQRISQLSSRLPHGLTFHSQKTLRNFFHNFDFECFGGLPWRLTPVVKNTCLAKSGSVFKNLFSFPSNFLWLFTFSLNWNSPKHSMSLSTNSIFALFYLQIFKKKVWVLISSPHISCFELHFREYLRWCFVFFFVMGLFRFFWIVLVWIVEVLFLCELVSVDGFMYYHVLVFLR